MIKLLADNPLLLLFIVSAIGYTIGRIKVKGSSLGVAAVLFVGLGFGALSPDLKLPEIIFLMGLAIFVYTIGLSSGPGFFASFNRKGLRDNLFVWGVLTIALLITVAAHFLLHLKPTITAGMYAGSLTNTPALAGLLDTINNTAPLALRDAMLAGIGIRSGHTFLSTLAQSGGVAIFFAAMVITCTTAFLALSTGYKVLKIPFGLLTGILAALHTQPAVLDFALEQSDNDLPNIGYALIFPIATITKILYAQLLLTLLK